MIVLLWPVLIPGSPATGTTGDSFLLPIRGRAFSQMVFSLMKIRPITLKEANLFVKQYHRHSLPTRGCRFAISAVDEQGTIRGVAICGRPVARGLDRAYTLEVTRVCTDGTDNLNSKLYASCKRIAQLMGYDRVITYTLEKESGSSLLAIGAECSAHIPPQTWDRANRRRKSQPVEREPKRRWELIPS